ncbi:class I SAM-dependent methyltransferase [Longimicrobium sp.]|jgi:ubiquinone/menaquinone biosynthesis C-methylase UbiE|uniref:class I SAM-dependent methyltransferase n=1 Tax=Longimicrobium sp. TaxID=2029185 RepID=UPI002F929F83
MTQHEVEVQRAYYASTAQRYDEMHVREGDEHYFALSFMLSMLDFLEIRSVLDVGAGTGRTVQHIRAHRPDIRVVGIEPVQALIDQGHAKGLSADELRVGDATALPYADGEFDLVCEFAVLHHVREPRRVVAEMLRVARRAVFISDTNRFGQGSAAVRAAKQLLSAVGLWKAADLVRTRGKGYTLSEGDGLAYSYSVFDDYRQVREGCRRIHLLNTVDGGVNPYRTAPHVALLGIK